MSEGITVPVTSPSEQLSDLSEGDTIHTEKWGAITVIEVIHRNDRHHFSVRGRWADSGKFCEFSLTQLLKHGVNSVTVRPD